MIKEIRQLHNTHIDLIGLKNRPQRGSAVLQEAGFHSTRRYSGWGSQSSAQGSVGVVDLADLHTRPV